MQPHGYSPVIPDFPGTPGLGAETSPGTTDHHHGPQTRRRAGD